MGRIIAVANQKGGVGKTTTAINLSSCLAELGQRVLVVDTDPQGNTTSGLGVDKDAAELTVYQLMIGECQIRECIEHTQEDREYILKKALAEVREEYDFVILDCPPSLSMLTVNAMTAADTVLVPIECEYYALEGLSQLMHTISLVQNRLNPDLEMEGVVFTMYDARTNLSLQVVENVKENLKQTVYKTIIPRNVRLAEAPRHGLPINYYDSKSAGAESYRLLAQEVIHRGDDNWEY